MNYLFKLPSWTLNDSQNLAHVNDRWKSEFAQILKKQARWLKKFGQDPAIYFKSLSPDSIESYGVIFRETRHYLEFYFQKINKIFAHPHIFSKFQKWTQDVGHLLGLLQSLKNVSNFYENLKTQSITNKKNFFLTTDDFFIKDQFEIYLQQLLKLLPSAFQPPVKNIFRPEKSAPSHLFAPHSLFKLIFKYNNQLIKHKKITAQEAVRITNLTFFYSAFFQTYLVQSTNFCQNF